MNPTEKTESGVVQEGVPGPFPPLERAGSEEVLNDSVTDEPTDYPVTEIPPAMEEILAAAESPDEDDSETEPGLHHRFEEYENDPDMPQTIEEAKRVFLSGKHFIEYSNALQDCDRLTPRWARLTRRLAIHARAYSILDRNDLIPSTFFAEISACPEKKR